MRPCPGCLNDPCCHEVVVFEQFCPGCKRTKTALQFYVRNYAPYRWRLSTYCKECTKAQAKDYRRANAEKRNAWFANYNAQPGQSERQRAACKRWREKNKTRENRKDRMRYYARTGRSPLLGLVRKRDRA